MRDKRLDKVDFLQSELEKLIRATETDRINFQAKEDGIKFKLQATETELQKLQQS